ncbi:phosphate propanoyltransferase [Clostridium botulinum]|uniref:Phosphate propanoyltransferase n=1 Tax=Clostridium botulinum TaxID=1491 RepID=A0A6B4JR68_CLOBO|nr:phosphate propanoyltransferase [Clostridium botulinum]EES50875.1 propanediol utilization protein [Clostridium botulinum E1 str. 'BoNT E Beluga']MBY6761643.1 phosphate propanoyltransferase [Clostridium botulinum]MBY6921703.1 phosphate propanoyltransferase [Clostridium botulinum]MCR1132678.1 phosphate propanoyltransferase [Clostridium botulinum]NFH69845.1 phosphate propanoyltransferase [Clostridium botulinum]
MVQVDIEKIILTVTKAVIEELNNYNESLIPVGISNKHIHLGLRELEDLFGENYKPNIKKELRQPGQYAYDETVEARGPKGYFERIRVLGPLRESTQLEVSISDEMKLGINAPIRQSGKLSGTPGILLKGPKGEIKIDQGVIIAARHIHLSTDFAKKYGYRDGELVDVTSYGPRKVTFHNVIIRVSDDFVPEMHIDTDEANASGLKNGDKIRITKVEGV